MTRVLIVAVLWMVASACGSKTNLEQATLLEGRGIESLVLGTTTLSQAGKALGEAAGEPSTSSKETEVEAPPLRLRFAAGEGGGEPVLHSIHVFRTSNKAMPNYEGKTSRGIGLLDTVEKMLAAYGQPDAEWVRMFDRMYYYETGVVFTAEHPSRIPDYDGPPPSPTAGVITRMEVTPPFDVVQHAEVAQHGGQLTVTGPPKTTLRLSPF